VVEAGVAIVALAAVKALLPDLPAPIRVTRQAMGWFEPLDPVPLSHGACRFFLLESRHGFHYGFPPFGSAPSRSPSITTATRPSSPIRTIEPSARRDERPHSRCRRRASAGANGRLIKAKTCIYTMTPDGDFIIIACGRAADRGRLALLGHGFKFALRSAKSSRLATAGTTRHDISRFGWRASGKARPSRPPQIHLSLPDFRWPYPGHSGC